MEYDKFTRAFFDFLNQRSTNEEFTGANEEFQDNLHKLEEYYQQIRQKLNLPKGDTRGCQLDFMDEVDN